jgi:hypothetical protein
MCFIFIKCTKKSLIFLNKTHVCIFQTSLDLIKHGYYVHLVADGCSSRCLTDRLYALERIKSLGAVLTTHESILYQLVSDSKHLKFKEIQQLIKVKSPDTGLLKRMSSI